MSTIISNSTRLKTPKYKWSQQTSIVLLLIPCAIIAMLPFVWMILSSLKTGAEIRQLPATFWPQEMTWGNYQRILSDPRLPLGLYYKNSFIVASLSTCLTLFTSSLFGYLLAKHSFRGRQVLFGFILATMILPFQVTMIPSYLILLKLGLLYKLWGLILPAGISAFGIFLMRQFSLAIPTDLLDAARIDGAGEWHIFGRIVIPLLTPAIASLGLLSFMSHWNAYLWPLIVLKDETRTLPIILTWYSNQHGSRMELTMAAAVLISIPILIVFLFCQKWLVKGITLTGLR